MLAMCQMCVQYCKEFRLGQQLPDNPNPGLRFPTYLANYFNYSPAKQQLRPSVVQMRLSGFDFFLLFNEG